jgi:hypothetical protein
MAKGWEERAARVLNVVCVTVLGVALALGMGASLVWFITAPKDSHDSSMGAALFALVLLSALNPRARLVKLRESRPVLAVALFMTWAALLAGLSSLVAYRMIGRASFWLVGGAWALFTGLALQQTLSFLGVRWRSGAARSDGTAV